MGIGERLAGETFSNVPPRFHAGPRINLRGGKLAILVANFAVGTTDGATWHSAGKCDSRWSKGLARYLQQSGKLCMELARPERKYHIICKKQNVVKYLIFRAEIPEEV